MSDQATQDKTQNTTHFGYQEVPVTDKVQAARVTWQLNLRVLWVKMAWLHYPTSMVRC